MREKIAMHTVSLAGRSEFGAVPLDPWRAIHAPDVSDWHNLYPNGSNTRIERRLTTAMVDDEWFKNEPRAHQLYEFMKVSLRDSQNRRIEMNGRVNVRDMAEITDDRMMRALEGTATPADLFTLLADMPELGSLELAKLSHPFDFEAPKTMDEELDELMLTVDGRLLGTGPRYKMKRVDGTIPAAMLLRKQDLMDYQMDEYHALRIVQRRGLMVFQGAGKEDELYFDRLVKNPKNHHALFAMVEGYIGNDASRQKYGWVQPQATSYYAKYVRNSTFQEL